MTHTVSRQIYLIPDASLSPFFMTDNLKDCAASFGLHDSVDLCCMLSLSVFPRFSFVFHHVVLLAEVSAVVGDHCSVLVDALWLCMTLALLRPVLTCVAAYCFRG